MRAGSRTAGWGWREERGEEGEHFFWELFGELVVWMLRSYGNKGVGEVDVSLEV